MTAGRVQGPLASRSLERLNAGNAGRTRGEALGAAHTGTLHSKSLAHDRTAAGQDLEIGHGTAAGAGTSSRGKGAQGRGRRALEKRAHSPGLLEHCLHGECELIIGSTTKPRCSSEASKKRGREDLDIWTRGESLGV